MEYKVMTKEELTNYIFQFWMNWGLLEYQEDNAYLYNEIHDHLETLEGVEEELDSIRCEFEAGWEKDSLEYENLDKLWNYLNWYKTALQKESE